MEPEATPAGAVSAVQVQYPWRNRYPPAEKEEYADKEQVRPAAPKVGPEVAKDSEIEIVSSCSSSVRKSWDSSSSSSQNATNEMVPVPEFVYCFPSFH